MQILSEISMVEWIAGVGSLTIATLVSAALIAITAHISNTDKHPSKKDIIFTEVCEAKENTVSVKIENLDNKVTELKTTVSKGFEAVTTQIQNLQK